MRVWWAWVERLGFYLVVALGAVGIGTGVLTVGRPRPPGEGPAPAIYERPVRLSKAGEAPPVFLHFFDWFLAAPWDERAFVDPFDWGKVGIHGEDRRSEEFYRRQFAYIRALGIDALAWEFHAHKGGAPPTYPPPAALAALRASGLTIAPFYDLELSFKVRYQPEAEALPVLSNPNAIRADDDTVRFMAGELREFFSRVPRELRARDRKGRLVVFVFGYGFDDADPNPARWARFAADLVARVGELAGAPPTFYWTSKNSPFAEHLFLHHRERFVPFHFVLDTPQSQFGHDAVTWNFGFDNLGVFRRDGLLRVVRLDRRYLEEMGWLAGATEPALVFLYGWNEPFEGSFLVPSMRRGDTKARLAKHYIQRLKRGAHPLPPKTLLVVDDLDELWGARRGDWHLVMLRALLLYPLRRFAPQSDVRTVAEVSPALLDQYEAVIDLTSRKVEQVSDWLLRRLDTHQLMIFDPLAGVNGAKLTRPFVSSLRYAPLNQEVELIGASRRLFARDDVQDAVACRTCGVRLAARVRYGWWRGARAVPLVVTRGDDVWVNAYSDNEDVLKAAFEALYRRPLGKSILYGEGLASQRLEVDPKTGRVTYNRLSRYSANQRWALPGDIDWYRLPEEVGEQHFRFVFGLDE